MKNKITSYLMAVVMLCTFMVPFFGTTASAATAANISTTKITAEKGSVVSVSFSLGNNPGLWGLKFTVGYDHNALEIKSVSAGVVFSEGEITPPPSLNKEKYIFVGDKSALKDTTENGTLLTINFEVKGSAEFKDYPITLDIVTAINVNGDDVNVNGSNGKIAVVNCLHSNNRWETVKAPTCTSGGTEQNLCNKCGIVLSTRETGAKGHSFTNKVANKTTLRSAATEKAKATYFYTCASCGEISKTAYFEFGLPTEPLPRAEPNKPETSTTVPGQATYNILEGANGKWSEGNSEGYTVKADGEFDKFSGINIDGKTISSDNYTVASGSTIVTFNQSFLNTLGAGAHTLTILYSDGSVETTFTIIGQTPTTTQPQTTQPTTTDDEKGSTTWIWVMVIAAAVILCGGAVGYVYYRKNYESAE